MKTYVMKVAVLALLAGVALSAGAKPAEVRNWENTIFATGLQSGDLVAFRGVAGRTLGPKIDVPISRARPA